MSRTSDLWKRHFDRAGGDSPVDAYQQYELTMLRELLLRLEEILEDNQVDPGVITTVIREMLYGSPSRVAAELRDKQRGEILELHARLPPAPVQPWRRS